MGTSQYNPLASESGQDAIARAIQAVGLNKMGNLSQLNTKSKTDLVSAINECKAVFDGYLHSGHFYREIIIDGYYHEGAFYEDSEYTTEITPVEGKIYKDITSSDTYAWDGEIQEYYEETATEITGQGDALYDELSQKKLYRWNGTAFVDALGLGTASALDVPASGDASTTQVVKGDDSRLLAVADKISKSQTAGLVKNDGTIDTESYTDEIDAIVNVYGSKNLLRYPYYETTKTDKGITFTDNGDGSVTVSGSNTSGDTAVIDLSNTTSIALKKGVYKVNGIPSGASTSSYYLMFVKRINGNSEYLQLTADSTVTFQDDGHAYVRIFVVTGTNLTIPITFYPMIRDARISDPTYVPYAMTNRELTEKVEIQVSGNNTFTSLENANITGVYKYKKSAGTASLMIYINIVTSAYTEGTKTKLFELPTSINPTWIDLPINIHGIVNDDNGQKIDSNTIYSIEFDNVNRVYNVFVTISTKSTTVYTYSNVLMAYTI